jgi:predicted amidohydrolase
LATRRKIALGQMRPVLGDVDANVEKHLRWIEEARREQASLIVFPELGLTGYQVMDLTLEVARTCDHPSIRTLIEQSHDIDIVFSFVEESRHHLFYIASVYASEGKIKSLHRKVYLPTYGMFDEGRYFAEGRRFQAFATQFGTAGMMICEDAWHVSSPYLLTMDGADLLIVPAAGPARSVTDQEHFGSHMFWRNLIHVYARLFGVNIVFVNRVGFEDGVNFFGGSAIVSAEGQCVTEAPTLEEALVFGEIDVDAVRRARYTTPLVRDEKIDLVMRELARIDAQREEPI